MKKFVLIIIIVGALSFSFLNYHFILLDKDFKILKKADLTLEYTFIDARGATGKAKLFLTPALVKAGIKNAFKEAGKF